MKVKKLFAIVLTTAMVLGLTACGDSAAGTAGAGTTGAETVSSDKTQALNVCLASEPATLDPALNSSVDGATMCLHLFSGIAKWEQDDAGNLVIVPDCAVELPEGVANEDVHVDPVADATAPSPQISPSATGSFPFIEDLSGKLPKVEQQDEDKPAHKK